MGLPPWQTLFNPEFHLGLALIRRINHPTFTLQLFKRRLLTRNQFIKIRTLHRHDVKLEKIDDDAGVLCQLVQCDCACVDENSRPRSGHPPALDTEEINQLVG